MSSKSPPDAKMMMEKGNPEVTEEETHNTNLSPMEILHSGDIVLIKCSLLDDPHAEASDKPGGTGYLTGDGINGRPKVVPVHNFSEEREDFRDFLFVVVDQLSYRAMKDLRKRKKMLNITGNLAGTAQVTELRNLEARAKQEEVHNMQILSGANKRPLRFGEVVQLQHLRTQQFIGVKAKFSAEHEATSRRVELQDGTMASWLHVNPYFPHRTQGHPVLFDEQVSLESVKLSENWNLNWYKHTDEKNHDHYEVNCCKRGRGFYFMLYSRAVPLDLKNATFALSFGLPLRLFNPHRKTCVAASCRPDKTHPYMRQAVVQKRDLATDLLTDFSAKEIWVIEPLHPEHLKDTGIEYSKTPILLRHLGSGRYLSVCESDLQDQGTVHDERDVQMPLHQLRSASGKLSPRGPFAGAGAEFETTYEELIAAKLVDTPTGACILSLELSSSTGNTQANEKQYVPRHQPVVMIKWDRSTSPFWLSCLGQHKGIRESLSLQWTRTRSSRDALRLEVVNDHPLIHDFDTVISYRQEVTRVLTPSIQRHPMSHPEWIQALMFAEQALTDMILFMAHSLKWRVKDHQFEKPDPLREAWSAHPERQRLARELKFIDETFRFFAVLASTMPDMQGREVDFSMRQKGKATGNAPQASNREADEQRVQELKARVIKVLVRLWLYCFLQNRSNEYYFYKKGWMDIIDALNGRGLGASDVFVALLSENRGLVRQVSPYTVSRFVNFIRVLGPLDTWLLFLKALCDPQNEGAASDKQQLVLTQIAFQGFRAPEAERAIVRRNREELLVTLALQGPVGIPLTRQSQIRRLDYNQCLAANLLAHGVHDVAVCWVHPERWEVGHGVLFHGPEKLQLPILQETGGRKWVSLAQVVWVLQPEKCCQAVTGKTWQEMQRMSSRAAQAEFEREGVGKAHKSRDAGNPFDVSNIELLRLLARYFLSQMQLVASLSKERQMNSIMALQNEYSFSVCLSGAADPRLPSSIRAAFFFLLMNIWVDRHPHYQVVVPRLMRQARGGDSVLQLPVFGIKQEQYIDSWSSEHAASFPQEVIAFYTLKSTDKMEGLVQAVCQYLTSGADVEHQVYSQEEDNKLTVAVVTCLSFLLRFGFFRHFQHLQELHSALLRTLDGRTDWLSATDRTRTAPKAQEQAPSRPSEVVPLLQGAESGAGAGSVNQNIARGVQVDDAAQRYAKCDEHKDVTLSKVKISEVLLQLYNIGLDTQISQVLVKFQDFVAGKLTVDAAVDEVFRVMDNPVLPFKQPGLFSPNAMLIDLIMYEDPKLLPLALELLETHCSMTGKFFEKLGCMTMLSESQQALMLDLNMNINQMSRILYSFENWGLEDAFSTRDTKPLEEILEISRKIRFYCSGGDPQSSGLVVQEMLRHTEFLSLASYWLKLDQKDANPENRALQGQLTCVVCSAASEFCRKNPVNQGELMTFMPLLSKILADDEFPECALLLSEIYQGNVENCQQVDDSLISIFGDLMVRSRRAGQYVPWFIGFFTAIVATETQAISHNQVLVIECLQKNRPKFVLNASMTLDRLKMLIPEFKSHQVLFRPTPDTWTREDSELIYYLYCLDLLCGLAKGRDNNLVNKPFVQEHFSVIHCIALLSKVTVTEEDTPPAKVTRHLRARWLQLLQMLLYDVDKALYDVTMMCSPVHLKFLEELLQSIESLLQLPPVGPTPREGGLAGVPPRFKEISEEKALYLSAILVCTESFFNGPFQACTAKDDAVSEHLQFVGTRYARRFQVLQKSTELRARLPKRCAEQLTIAMFRVISSVLGKEETDAASAHLSHDEEYIEPKKRRFSKRTVSQETEDQAKWTFMIDTIEKDSRYQERIDYQDYKLGHAFLTIFQETDPDHPEYTKCLHAQPPIMDYRRSTITVSDCTSRLVRHSSDNMYDLATLRRVLRVMACIVSVARQSGDPILLSNIQVELCEAGVGKLLVTVLDKHKMEDIRLGAWRLFGELLKGLEINGQTKTNQVVQKNLKDVLQASYDDTGLWESLSDVITQVGRNVKALHAFRLLPHLTSYERKRLVEYRGYLEQAITAMDTSRLMVEGHFKEMQDYLYSQEGNIRSWNVPGLGCYLLSRLCKTSADANGATDYELDCVRTTLALLTELAQGPNLRNQEFLSHMGLIELVFKLLDVTFTQLQKAAGDVYPSTVRQLKAEMMNMLLSLLEGRLDNKIHKTTLQRGDPRVIKERIEFVYLYFVLGSVAVSSGKVQSGEVAAVPVDGNLHALMLSTADHDEQFMAVERDCSVAEELLEDLSDDQLSLLFDEGFYHVQMVLELVGHSLEFKSDVMPIPVEEDPFIDDEAEYRTHRDYARARTVYRKRHIYRKSFEFLRRFVKTIEVVVGGHIQWLHFQMPVTALWYVQGASKQKILDEVPYHSPDIKLKAFVQMCIELHSESRLILELSRFSLLPRKYRRWAQRNLPDGLHRPFWVFLTDDAKRMQDFLRLTLYLSLALAIHTGICLQPVKGDRLELQWSSTVTLRVSEVLGGLHLGCTLLWLCIYTAIRAPLLLTIVEKQNPSRRAFWNTLAAAWTYLSQPALAWRFLLAIFCALALLGRHWWVYSFLVTDFFYQSPSLQTVLNGIIAPSGSLFMTFLGAAIITFVYAAIGLHYFRREFGEYCDSNILVCTESILYMGTRSGIIGLSNMMDHVGPEDETWFSRNLYDISYFVIFGIMLLNTIVALIVDSFQTQRREASARENNLETQTFISCLDRKTIETVAQQMGIADGFEFHELQRQYKWDYMAFIFQLFEKDAQNFTGPETKIMRYIENNDISWLPIGRSKMIEGKTDDTKQDTLAMIGKQNENILASLQNTKDTRAAIYKAIGTLARMMRDKTETVQEQLTQVVAVVKGVDMQTPPQTPKDSGRSGSAASGSADASAPAATGTGRIPRLGFDLDGPETNRRRNLRLTQF